MRATRDARIWDMYLSGDLTQDAIGKAEGISSQRVGQILARYRDGRTTCPTCRQRVTLPAADIRRLMLLTVRP